MIGPHIQGLVEGSCVKQANATRCKPEQTFRGASDAFLLRIFEDRRDPRRRKENRGRASKDTKGQEMYRGPGKSKDDQAFEGASGDDVLLS